MLRTVASGLIAAAVVAGTLLTPAPAKAWWTRDGWRGPAVYGPPVVVVRPVHPVRVARHWFPAHHTRFGVFVPGHWG